MTGMTGITGITGRKREWDKLEKCMEDGTAQLVIVNGRRRVGKTFLIDTFFQKHYAFQITGVQNSTMEENLEDFSRQLKKYSGKLCPKLENWADAFWSLADYLDTCVADEKLVVFFDEMPWLAEPASAFMRAFESFWGNWANPAWKMWRFIPPTATLSPAGSRMPLSASAVTAAWA